MIMGLNFVQAVCKAEHKDVLQRTRNKVRQMIVNRVEGSKGWKELTEKELVEKARIIRKLMG